MFDKIYDKPERLNDQVLGSTLELAIEIARGREGRRIGTLFTRGDAQHVLEHSRPLNPPPAR